MIQLIEFNEIKTPSLTIDVRTVSEYRQHPMLAHNVPVMDEQAHQTMKKIIILACPFISYHLYKNRHRIHQEIQHLLITHPNQPIVIACSRGRLRSPLMAVYISLRFKVDVYVVKRGIKDLVGDKANFMTTWFKI